ncbi:hypothetical protein [Leisingera sp. M523]|uniref:hypothetical protein n=1 Tax=Leisingera sp. M523 TaxID=2867013 RepID=UPI0021A30900|nr:hypothetical protein [Leisingera sp. M523]UWQ30257.1 hypothetical protein K3557_06890 [Leisingera sp. M523]
MSKPDQAAYEAAVATLTAEDMTADGLPKMKALNAALAAAGIDAITADERDAFVGDEDNQPAAEEGAQDEAGSETAPAGKVNLTLNDAPCDPLPLYVHGCGSFSLRIGQTLEVPREALDALHNAGGVDFTVEEIEQ